MIICNRCIAIPLQTMTLRLRETLMSDSNQPTVSIVGNVSIVTSPVLLLVFCVLCTQQWWYLRGYPHELLSSWLPP